MEKALVDLAVVAHELKTPIYSIYNTAELLMLSADARRLEPSKVQEYTEQIKYFCNHMMLLANNILSASSLDDSVSKCRYEQLDASEFAEHFIAFLAPYTKHLSVSIQSEIRLKGDRLFVCDFEKLERVLLNFVSNGIKYNTKKTKRLVLCVYEDKENVCFSIKDNGIGMSEDVLSHITEPFFRAEQFTTRATEGSGLGLTVAEKIATLLQGTLSFQSTPGKGTTATIALPKAPQMPSQMGEPSKWYLPVKSTYETELVHVLKDHFRML